VHIFTSKSYTKGSKERNNKEKKVGELDKKRHKQIRVCKLYNRTQFDSGTKYSVTGREKEKSVLVVISLVGTISGKSLKFLPPDSIF